MKDLLINHYIDKKLVSSIVEANSVKLEIRAKMVVLIDKDTVVFACKISDFISMQF